MPQQHLITESTYTYTLPVVDEEFDDFEVIEELAASLRESESANFYHGARDTAE